MEHSEHAEGKFRLGSVTKQFIAVSIFLLQDRYELRIDDPSWLR
jgi:CubicO group peptidase (beta-lactamase class C family)